VRPERSREKRTGTHQSGLSAAARALRGSRCPVYDAVLRKGAEELLPEKGRRGRSDIALHCEHRGQPRAGQPWAERGQRPLIPRGVIPGRLAGAQHRQRRSLVELGKALNEPSAVHEVGPAILCLQRQPWYILLEDPMADEVQHVDFMLQRP
jgi:hypothetical protein